jgi:YD repeat-containing protein
VQRLVLAGTAADGRATTTELVSSTSRLPLPTSVGERGTRSQVASYDAQGRLVQQRDVQGRSVVVIRPGGFAVLTR